jgi:Ca2+-binding RTX toxin-like protein
MSEFDMTLSKHRPGFSSLETDPPSNAPQHASLAGPPGVFAGTAGDDNFAGTIGDDTFNMADGGNDTVAGKVGDDTFDFGGELTAADSINGGADFDIVTIAGNYTAAGALTFGATTMLNVELLTLGAGRYDLTMNNHTVAAGQNMSIDATALTSSQSLTFDGSAELDGGYTITVGAADAFITGGAGDDTVNFGGGFRADDRIDGGGGIEDVLFLSGDYSAGLTFAPTTISRIDRLIVDSAHSYFFTLDNGNVAFDQSMVIDGTRLAAGDRLTVDGSDETSGQLKLEGGAGECIFIGGGGDDSFDAGSGFNAIKGGSGDDTITFSAGFGTDTVDGGSGFDAMFLAGGATATFAANTLQNVEKITLLQDPAPVLYHLTLDAATVRFGEALTIDGSALDFNDSMSIDASAVTDGRILMIGGAGSSTFTLSQTGQDIVRGGSGGNTFIAGPNLEATDRLSGNIGNDNILFLSGDYSDRLEFEGRTIRNIQLISLAAGHSYNLATADGNVAAGAILSIGNANLGASDRLIFDGSKESNGRFIITSGAGNDVITGGAGNDTINTGGGTNTVDLTHGGNDTVTGGSGNDTYIFGAAFTNSDVVNTGGGNDTLLLDGNYATTTFNLPAVRFVQISAGNSYVLAATLSTGTMSISGNHLGTGDVLAFTGSGAGAFSIGAGGANDNIIGGSAADSLAGNGGDDLLRGNAGQDTLFGGAGKDTFIFGTASESTSITFDKITAANFDEDKFNVAGTIAGIDAAVTSGALHNSSKAVFDSDLTGLMSGHLNAGHAILFTCNGGNFIAHKFLIVDQNGTAGYQADADLVIEVTGLTGTLDIGDFI